jgi:hypothetical protein
MACLALLPAMSADVAFASTVDARAIQILIHGVLLDTPCCMKNVVISLQRVNGRMGTLFPIYVTASSSARSIMSCGG